MEKMQEYIDYIFYQVWCEASELEYDISLFDRNVELREIIEEFHYTEPKSADFFTKGIQEIFLIFKNLSASQIDLLKSYYESNNDIENLCMNNPALTSTTYADIELVDVSLSKALYKFFTRMYSHNFLSLKAITDKIGEIGNHYKEFVMINRKKKCPYCGLYPIDGEYVHTREAYDHYLPKSKYPFSSINFKNLAPICNKCNSGYKSSKDPLTDEDGQRRKAFYSYNQNPYNIEINMILNTIDIENLTPDNIRMTFGPSTIEEELKTWDELFGIEERYKDECCSEDAWYWMFQIFEECEDKTPSEFLEVRLRTARKFPYKDTNFLRKPFLEACAALDIFNTLSPKSMNPL